MDSAESRKIVHRGNADIATYFRCAREDAPWVVLVNGHTRPASDFRAFMRFLEQEGFNSATLDNRGAGATKYASPFTVTDMVEDVLAVFDELTGSAAVHCLGISMGGVIAQHLVARYPERVQSIALVSSTCSDEFVSDSHLPWSNDLEQVLAKMRPYFSEAFFTKNKMLVNAMCKQILKNMDGQDFAEQAAAQREAVPSFNTFELLGKIQCPSIVFHGTADAIISRRVVEEFNQRLADLKVVLYEGVGHLLLAECPKQFYQDYVDYLRSIRD